MNINFEFDKQIFSAFKTFVFKVLSLTVDPIGYWHIAYIIARCYCRNAYYRYLLLPNKNITFADCLYLP